MRWRRVAPCQDPSPAGRASCLRRHLEQFYPLLTRVSVTLGTCGSWALFRIAGPQGDLPQYEAPRLVPAAGAPGAWTWWQRATCSRQPLEAQCCSVPVKGALCVASWGSGRGPPQELVLFSRQHKGEGCKRSRLVLESTGMLSPQCYILLLHNHVASSAPPPFPKKWFNTKLPSGLFNFTSQLMLWGISVGERLDCSWQQKRGRLLGWHPKASGMIACEELHSKRQSPEALSSEE